MNETAIPRIILLMKASTYRAPAFLAAAERLGVEVVQAFDTPRALTDPSDPLTTYARELPTGQASIPAAPAPQPARPSPATQSATADETEDVHLQLDFSDPDGAVATLRQFSADSAAAGRPLRAVLAVDDSGALLAARAGAALGLPHNDAGAALAARDKYEMRARLAAGGLPTPPFRRFTTADDPAAVAATVAQSIGFPCVVKPLRRSGSQGVMRADDAAELQAAIARLARILGADAERKQAYLVEGYLPGVEVALEGILIPPDTARVADSQVVHARETPVTGEGVRTGSGSVAGGLPGGVLRPNPAGPPSHLHLLALFDKPDPLDGPFFEETIYLTPSRLPAESQKAVVDATAAAAHALGLRRGPIHAELRVNDNGAWLLEVAGRSIGGLCSRVLQFSLGEDEAGASLEELILRQAAGMEMGEAQREGAARGVMMIPIPEGGILRGYDGVGAARAVAGIEEVEITARLHQPITPLPEGDSYLGFIFARGETPAAVETALREAHGCLQFQIAPLIPLRLQ